MDKIAVPVTFAMDSQSTSLSKPLHLRSDDQKQPADQSSGCLHPNAFDQLPSFHDANFVTDKQRPANLAG